MGEWINFIRKANEMNRKKNKNKFKWTVSVLLRTRFVSKNDISKAVRYLTLWIGKGYGMNGFEEALPKQAYAL